MDVGSRVKSVVGGVVLSLVYAALMLGTWYLSVDQWYLPAGIRAAALLFLPWRLWPYVFAGDAMAFLVLRGPKAEKYSEQWAYLSPFLLAPLISVVPLIYRRLLGEISARERWFPAVAFSIALWSVMCNLTLNYTLSGPIADNSLVKVLRYAVGQYLGIFMFVPPLLVWMRRNDGTSSPRRLLVHSAIAVGLIAVVYVGINSGVREDVLRQFLLLLMIAPAVGLTFLHGWRGASIGIAAAGIAYGLPTTAFDYSVNSPDAATFVVQQALAVAATALFVLGATISSYFDRARRLGLAEQHAMKIAQSSFLSSERHLRDRVMSMARIQADLDESRQKTIEWLDEMGHHAAAQDLMRRGARDAQLFDDHAAALYPIRIERQGLYDVLQSAAFTGVWAGGADVRFLLRGKARALRVDLQLAAYRCACNAMSMLSHGAPGRYTVRARAGSHKGRSGIVISVTALGGQEVQPSQASVLELELEGRVKMHGGTLRRRHANRISFLLVESNDPAGSQSDAEQGSTVHQSPLLV